MKDLFRIGPAGRLIRNLPEDARRIAGEELRSIQAGLEPSDWRPMPTVGSGVIELRIHTRVEYRVFYVAKFQEGIYILHAFVKKSRKTAAHDVNLGRKRYSEVLEWRRQKTPRHE